MTLKVKARPTPLYTFYFQLFTFFLVRPAGLEPAAYWFEASRSIQLSYGRALGPKIIARAAYLRRVKACGALRSSCDFRVPLPRATAVPERSAAWRAVYERGHPQAGSRYIG